MPEIFSLRHIKASEICGSVDGRVREKVVVMLCMSVHIWEDKQETNELRVKQPEHMQMVSGFLITV